MAVYYQDVMGEKIIFEGRPVILEDYVSCYEGDFWYIEDEGEHFRIPDDIEHGLEILKELEKKEKRTNNHCTWKDSIFICKYCAGEYYSAIKEIAHKEEENEKETVKNSRNSTGSMPVCNSLWKYSFHNNRG